MNCVTFLVISRSNSTRTSRFKNVFIAPGLTAIGEPSLIFLERTIVQPRTSPNAPETRMLSPSSEARVQFTPAACRKVAASLYETKRTP